LDILRDYAEKRFTGSITLHFVQGFVKKIIKQEKIPLD